MKEKLRKNQLTFLIFIVLLMILRRCEDNNPTEQQKEVVYVDASYKGAVQNRSNKL